MSPSLSSLPVFRSDLACWRDSDSNQMLIRDRRVGETYRLGEEEYYLLSLLDGCRMPEDICAAFRERFKQSLTAEEFEEFLELAAERNLLDDAAGDKPPPDSRRFPAMPETGNAPATTRRRFQIAPWLLNAAANVLEWPAGTLNRGAAWIRDYRLRRWLYVPRPDDIFIATYPRSGTTWMQMILFQLLTDGNMNFPHIAEFCPWFEASGRSARGFETRPSPRLFKTHMPWRLVPKGARYIYVARNGMDMVVSYYHLRRNYSGYEGTFDEFFEEFLRGKSPHGSWFDHVRGWWERRDDPHVLFLNYEELSADLEACLRRIAAFLGRDVPPEKLPGIIERCGFAFMKQHEEQFDPVLEQLWERGVQLKSFLRQGRVGDGAVSLDEEQQARFDEAFARRLKPLGVPMS